MNVQSTQWLKYLIALIAHYRVFVLTIGDAPMTAYWQDPDFDPAESAFYYVRVLEILTPRWTTYDAAFFKIKRPDNVPATVQDREYTSPIWYTP